MSTGAGELALRALSSRHPQVSGSHLSAHSHPVPAAHLVSPQLSVQILDGDQA